VPKILPEPYGRTKSVYSDLEPRAPGALGTMLITVGVVAEMDEGRKRVLAIVAGIIVARHLTTADDPIRRAARQPKNRQNGCCQRPVGGAYHAED
jgi:hypothetical protein